MATQENIDEFVSADGYDPHQQEDEEGLIVSEDYDGQDYGNAHVQSYETSLPAFDLTTDNIEGEEDRRATQRAMEEAAIAAAKEAERNNKEFEKQAVKFAQSKAKTTVKETEEEACKRLADKYSLYLQHFKHLCTKPKLTGKESRKELERLVTDAKTRLDASGMADAAQQNWWFLAQGLHFGGKAIGAQVEGPVKNLNDEIIDSMGMFEQEIKEMMILWPWLFRRPLLFRVGGKLLQIVVKVHTLNSAAMIHSGQREAPEETAYTEGKNRVELPAKFANLFSRV